MCRSFLRNGDFFSLTIFLYAFHTGDRFNFEHLPCHAASLTEITFWKYSQWIVLSFRLLLQARKSTEAVSRHKRLPKVAGFFKWCIKDIL